MQNYEPLIQQRIQRMRVVMATSKDARALTTESSYTGHLRAFMRFSVTVPSFTTRRESPMDRAVQNSTPNVIPFRQVA